MTHYDNYHDADTLPAPRRGRSVFSFRFACLNLVILSLVFGFTGTYIRRCERQRFVITTVRCFGGTIYFTDQRQSNGGYRWEPEDRNHSGLGAAIADAYRRSISEIRISGVDELSPEFVAAISRLPDLEKISISPLVADTVDMQRFKEKNPHADVHVSWKMRHVPMRPVRTTKQCEHAVASEYAVLFIDGDWSIYALSFRPILADFVARWQDSEHPFKVAFYRLDFTEYPGKSPLWLSAQKWMRSHSIPSGAMKTYGGVGRIIWIRKGKVVEFGWVWKWGRAWETSGQDFVDRTKTLLSNASSPD